jgi:hypothetical protein
VLSVQTSSIPVIDSVGSYLGMRKISLNRTSPTNPLRIFLNNKATLQLGLLDQVNFPVDFCISIEPGSLQPFLTSYCISAVILSRLQRCVPVCNLQCWHLKGEYHLQGGTGLPDFAAQVTPVAENQLQLQAIIEALP